MGENIQRTICKYITTELLFSKDKNLLTFDKFLLGDVIDSIGLQMLVPFLEIEFNISIPDIELIPENFSNINSIADLVKRLSESNQ